MDSILSIDPGLTTGYSVLRKDDDDVWYVYDAGELPRWTGIDSLIKEHEPTIILYERFHLVSVAVDKTPIEVIGVIQYLAEREGYIDGINLISRSPNERMFATKRFGGEPKHKSIHARSSINHAVSWLYVNKGVRRFDPTIYETA